METPEAPVLDLLDDAFERLCAQPLALVLEPAPLFTLFDRLADPALLADVNDAVIVPARDRAIARASKSSVTHRAWLPDDVAQRIVERASRPKPLPRKMVDELVASERVRDGVKATLTEALTSFVQKASSGGGAAAAGAGMLRGALSFGAKAAGKMLGGVGEEIQRQLLERVGDFVDGAMANVQQRIAERLKSDDTAKALGKRVGAAVQKALDETEAAGAKRAARVAWADVDAAVPDVIAHNLRRPELRDAIADEISQLRAEHGDVTVGSLLDVLGVRDLAKGEWRRIGSVVMQGSAWVRSA